MFFTYIARELRRRRRQAIVVALGLGVGIGLVVTVSALASGVRTAQATVLQSLYGVGTDVTVTQAATPGSGGPQRFGINPGNQSQEGRAFSRDRVFASPGLATLTSDQVDSVAKVTHVSSASGGLSLTSIHLSGTFAQFPSGGGGGFGGGSQATPGTRPSVPPVNINSYSIDGVDVTNTSVGPVSPSEITKGRYFALSDANAAVAIVDAGYAKQHKLAVGSTLTIDGAKYTVIGVATPPSGGQSSDVYTPLAKAQAIADLSGKVNRIYVQADSASNIAAVQSSIQAIMPTATVTTAADLANQVTGSLSSASSLSGDLGRRLSIAVLIAAFVVASLLTIGAVGRRTREFGTLKALGWRSRRVVGQVMGESIVQGILGGVIGIAIGLGGALLVSKLAPNLKATLSNGSPSGRGGFFGGGGGGPFGQALGSGGNTASVPLHASVDLNLLLMAIGLALIGGVIAGSLGGWRAARLRPAEALRRVE